MSDTKESMPAQPQTREMEAVKVPTSQLDALILEVRAAREEQRASTAELTEKVDMLSVNVENLQHDAKDTRLRLGRMERELDEVKDRQANNSVRVKGESEVNLKQDAVIAEILTKVTALEQRPDTSKAVLDKLTEIGKTPTGQKIVGALVTVLLLSLALLAAKLQSQVDAIEKKPATVQPAPTVYLPAPADGGAL